VGRVAAIRNLLAEEFRGDRTGYFGWFECPREPAVAAALLGEAWRRLAARGCDRILGPVSYSTNDTCGLLVEGFDGPPVLMMPWNPPWYEGLLLGCGLAPAEDLLAWLTLHGELGDLARVERVVARARARHGWSIRPLRLSDFDAELERIRGLYNRAWERNWGFVPMTEEEFRWAAADLRRIVDPEFVLLAERGGDPVGFALCLPDMNQVLRRMGGSLWPLGWAKALWYARRIDFLRVLALGVLPEARNQGIEAGLYGEIIRRSGARGYRGGECSWTLARNEAIGRVMETVGGRVYRRYRLYEGPIAC
jgi:GNAT superfamily N-acetyltransferase